MVYSDIIICLILGCACCVVNCRPFMTYRIICLFLFVHVGTFLLYLLGVGGAYLIKYTHPWDRLDWYIPYATWVLSDHVGCIILLNICHVNKSLFLLVVYGGVGLLGF